MGMQHLTLADIEALRVGTWVLGTGGGGNPYHMALGATLLAKQTAKNAHLIQVDDLAEDALVAMVAFIGAPLVCLERLHDYEQSLRPIRILEQKMGKKVDALLPLEIGGANGMYAFPISVATGIPVVDADCMGRAYPELQMITPAINNEPCPPAVMSDIRNSDVYFPNFESWDWGERLMRVTCAEMGAVACMGFALTGEQVKQSSIHGTITQAKNIGNALISANKNNQCPIQALQDTTPSKFLFEGKVVDVNRRIERGFLKGKLTIKGTGNYTEDELLIHFQNEFSVALLNNEVLVTTPDLICVLDTVSGDGVGTDAVRYGQRLSVLALPTDPIYLSKGGLKAVSPRAFGFDMDYKSVFV